MSNETPIKTKTHANLSEMLLKAGIADSRVPDLRRALIDVHKAYCDLDPWGRSDFKHLCGDRKFHEVLAMIASVEDLNTDL
jgi:hypothetical protein